MCNACENLPIDTPLFGHGMMRMLGAHSTYGQPPYSQQNPVASAPPSPTLFRSTSTGTDEWDTEELSEDELDALTFEDSVLSGRHGSAPIAIPGANTRSQQQWRRAPLPVAALKQLDAHAWQNEPHMLSKWARGAGIGKYSNSVTDEMFTPGSPPRRK